MVEKLDSDEFNIGIRISAYNAEMKRARKDCGFTQKELAHRCNCSTGYISHIETFTCWPSTQMAEIIAQELKLEAETLFPSWLEYLWQEKRKPTLVLERPVRPRDVRQFVQDDSTLLLLGGTSIESSPEKAYSQHELKQEVQSVLDGLSEVERTVIQLRFFEGLTLEQAGERLGEIYHKDASAIGKERVRQVEALALRKLRHPHSSTHLRPYLEGLNE